MRTKAVLITIAVVFFAVVAFADQAAYITQVQAEKAAAFLKDRKQVRHYCAPCEDKGDRIEDINAVEAAPAGYQQYWEVKVNGEGIDLAYVYFRDENGKWKNIAKELNVKVKDVPKYLD